MDFETIEKDIEQLNKIHPRLHELLINDGPEFSYTIVFREKNCTTKKYKIGVCIRGLPICKPVE